MPWHATAAHAPGKWAAIIPLLLLALVWPGISRPAIASEAEKWLTQVEGIVSDALSGAPVPGARISIADLGQVAWAGPDGAFALPGLSLPAPVYSVTIAVSAPGYGKWSLLDVRLIHGDALRLRVQLADGPLVEEAAPPRALTDARQSPLMLADSLPLSSASQIYPPRTIRVGITGQTKCITPPLIQYVEVVDFRSYCQHVLPNEWIGRWPAESLRAGAMAVKTYAWYWVNQGGKWAQYGADVVDSTCDQVYAPSYSYATTDQAVDDTWPYRMVRAGQIFPAYYFAGTYDGNPGDGNHMTQWGSKYWADQGKAWDWILGFYYTGMEILDIPTLFHAYLPRVCTEDLGGTSGRGR